MLEDIITDSNQSDTRIKAANSFIHLCTLTEILGEVLPLVYDLNLDPKETWKQIHRLEIALHEWEDRLPNYLRRDNDENPRVSGSSSLQLSYLAVRLLLNRISLHVSNPLYPQHSLHEKTMLKMNTKGSNPISRH